jgi:PAS domain S-box-containing protein
MAEGETPGDVSGRTVRVAGTLALIGVAFGIERAGAPFAQWATDVLQLGLALAAAVSCLRTARASHGAARLFWAMLSAFAVTWAIGQALWTLGNPVVEHGRVLAPWDPFFLLTLVPLLAAIASRPDRADRWGLGFKLDVALTWIVAAYVYLYVAAAHAFAGAVFEYGRWLNLLLNVKSLLVLAGLLWLLRTSVAPWLGMYRKLAVSLALLQSGGALVNLLLLSGTYRPGLHDLPWTLPFLWLALAARGAPAVLDQACRPAGESLPQLWSETRNGTVLAGVALVSIPALHVLLSETLPAAPEVLRLRNQITAVATALAGGLFVLRQLRVLRQAEQAVRRQDAQRSAALETLRERESLLRAIVDSEPECVKLLDRQGRVLSMNPAGLALIEASGLDEVAGRCVYDLVSPEHRGSVRALTQDVFDGRAGTLEFEIVGLRGRRRWLDTHAVPLRDASGRVSAALAIARDITERRDLEERYRQAHKMEAVGRLAGGIAHDFNNLLNVILGYGELLLKRLPVDDPQRRNAAEIHKAATRSADLVRQLLAFSRRQVLRPAAVDLRAVVAGLEGMLRRSIREDIELRCELAPELGRVWADRGQLEQVIVNLVVNARDAMPDGGTLTIAAANVERCDGAAAGVHVRHGDYVRLVVSDTGEGMDASTQARVFEPFFTTKEQGKGTGLGLATVYGIVKQSGGYIWLRSEPGAGTTFTIWLPRTFAEHDSREPASPAGVRTGTETVLLVEDEDGMRDITAEVLREHGYKVIEASSAAAALEAARGEPSDIQLLLTDVILQDKNGRELSERLLRLRPRVRVLFMSGHTRDAIGRHGVLEPGIAFLAKPFSVSELTLKVRAVLDGR